MRRRKLLGMALLAGALATGGAIANRGDRKAGAPAPLPATPQLEALELVEVRAFALDEPFPHFWRAEQPDVRAGYLLVLRADAGFLRPRQVAEPVLYVGDETAERLNDPSESGHLVCLVPAPLAPDGSVALDPTAVPIWFGEPDLPERVDTAEVARQRKRAEALGVGLPDRVPTLARATPAQTLFVRDRGELELLVADLIERWSPGERRRVEGLRVPRSF